VYVQWQTPTSTDLRSMKTLKFWPAALLLSTAGIVHVGLAAAAQLSEGEVNPTNERSNHIEPCCGPISDVGTKLLGVLDQSDVEHLWLPHAHVNWETGMPEAGAPGYTSHCSAYAAAIGKRLDVYMLRPPEHSPVLLASAQTAWFGRAAGEQAGWYPIGTAQQAQSLSNAGELVVASYESPNPRKPGHISIVRPSLKSAAALAEDGPEITQAGAQNYTDSNVRTGFKHHDIAGPNGVLYFGHVVRAR
jgi:hypothetical protein